MSVGRSPSATREPSLRAECEAIQNPHARPLDCFAALAMTMLMEFRP